MSFISNGANDSFGNEFGNFVFCVLEITVFGAVFHGLDATHSAVRLDFTSIEKRSLAGRFFGTCEQTARHDGVCASH
jgi:hypothetical protein